MKAELYKFFSGTRGFFIAWMVLPILPFLILQPFIAYSCRITLPFYVLAGFIALHSRIASIVLLIVVTSASFLIFLTSVFRLSLSDTVIATFSDGGKINLFADPLYAAVMLTGIASLAGMIFAAWSVRPRPHILKALGLMYLLIVIDGLATTNFGYALGKGFSGHNPGVPRSSAFVESGAWEAVRSGQGPFLIVMVEALGRFRDPAYEDLLFQPFYSLSDREIRRGYVKSFGSTTAGEIRELCGLSGTHGSVLGGKLDTSSCLPNLLKAQGREVIAVHGFSGDLFERTRWYPQLGFTQMHFGWETVPQDTQNVCSSVFRGPCDFEVASKVGVLARQSIGIDPPPLIYWLTLNTHIPAVPHASLSDPFDCAVKGGVYKDSSVCSLAVIWLDVMVRVADIAEENPYLDILVVGDHPPPVFSRRGRAMFKDLDVPWVRLTPISSGKMETVQ